MTGVPVYAIQPRLIRACQMRHHHRHLWVSVFTSDVVGWSHILTMDVHETEEQNRQEKCFHADRGDTKGDVKYSRADHSPNSNCWHWYTSVTFQRKDVLNIVVINMHLCERRYDNTLSVRFAGIQINGKALVVAVAVRRGMNLFLSKEIAETHRCSPSQFA